MSLVRRFLVAPSLVRLIRKERGGSRITEGYFAPQAGRVSYVRVDGQACHLVLVTAAPDGTSSEERTDVPRAHGDALMDVCSGKAAYDRTALALGGGREALIDRYVAPGEFDLVSVTFDGRRRGPRFPGAGLVRSRGHGRSELRPARGRPAGRRRIPVRSACPTPPSTRSST